MGGGQAAGLMTAVLTAAVQFVDALIARWNDLNAFIVAHLGPTGQWAFWAFCALVVLLIVAYATGIVFKILRWIVLPAAVFSIVLLTLAPSWPPTTTFPVFLGLTSLAMVVRRR